MKTINVIVLAVGLMAAASCGILKSNKASSKKVMTLEEAREQEYLARKEQLKEGGWQVYASSRSLEVLLLTHYDKLNTKGDDVTEVVGTWENITDLGQGLDATDVAASQRYAAMSGAFIRGRQTQDGASMGSGEDFSHFYGAYERLLQKEIKGELQRSYTIYRQTGVSKSGKPLYQMESYYIVDQERASKARIQAYQLALKETEIAQETAVKIANFVAEGFQVEMVEEPAAAPQQ